MAALLKEGYLRRYISEWKDAHLKLFSGGTVELHTWNKGSNKWIFRGGENEIVEFVEVDERNSTVFRLRTNINEYDLSTFTAQERNEWVELFERFSSKEEWDSTSSDDDNSEILSPRQYPDFESSNISRESPATSQ